MEHIGDNLCICISGGRRLNNYTPLPEGGGGILFYLCPSFRPSKIFFATFFSLTVNQLSRQTGSRNLTDSKTLPTIWHTYMKLVTKYQISVINSCLDKCNEKCENVTVTRPLIPLSPFYTPTPRRGRGVYCFTSVHPRYFSSHFSQ
jgi:hypothetical protein